MVLLIAGSLVGLVLLARAADEFVVGAARLASIFRMSPVVIGAVVVGFGTSAPEMLVSGLASSQDSLDIAVGNIVGSNVANLTLVLGAASFITAIGIRSKTLRREAPLSAGSVVVFAVLVQDGLERWEGIVLGVLLVLVLGYVLRDAKNDDESDLTAEVDEFLDEAEIERGREIGRTVVGLVGTLAGAQLLVWGATGIAEEIGLDEGFVGLTLVAIGTSLPELTTAVAAARKGEEDLIVGNLLGSNIFNSLAVGAVAGLVGPGPLDDPDLAGIATVIMVVVAVAAWLFMMSGRRVVRWEGIALLAGYAVTIPLLAG